MAQVQIAAQHKGLHCIQPIVSLRSFCPPPVASRSHRNSRQYRGGRHATRRADVSVAARASDSTDRELMRDITRLMPDPQSEDELLAPDTPYQGGWGFSNGPTSASDPRMQDAYNDLMTGTDLFGTGSGSYGNDADAWDEDFYERLEQMPPEVQRAELQRIADQDVREEWEIEQAQDKAMALHHKQMEAAPSRYDMANRLGEIMEELERHDYYAGDGQDRVPSWIRAHFILEAELEQQRAGEDPASLHPTVGGGQREKGDALERPMGDILPGSDSQDTILAYLDDMIGAEPAEQPQTYSAAAYGGIDELEEEEDETLSAEGTFGNEDDEDAPTGLAQIDQADLDALLADEKDTSTAEPDAGVTGEAGF